MELRRKISDRLVAWKNSGFKKSILLDGARQTGKTYSVRKFGESYSCFIEINFEIRPELRRIFSGDLDSRTIITRIKETINIRDFDPGDTLIFFDEIQSCPSARASLKSFTEDDSVDVIASGSLLGLNYRDVPSYPVGYEKHMTMESLDFEEFLWAFGVSDMTIKKVRDSIKNREPFDEYTLEIMSKYYSWYMANGGMPEAVSVLSETKDFDSSSDILISLKDGYRNDAAKYAPSQDRNRIFSTFDSIPVQLAKESNRFLYTDIENNDSVRSSKREYRSSIDWLKDSGIIIECRRIGDTKLPFSIDDDLFKLYTRDQGILMSMMSRGTRSAILDSDIKSNLGYVAENCVGGLLMKAGLNVNYYKSKTTEVDFICDIDGTVTGIEVKSGNNPKSKSLNALMNKGLIEHGIKFRNGNICKDDHGIECFPLFVSGFMDCFRDRSEMIAEKTRFDN